MRAYKGFEPGMICRGYQFKKDEINRTEKANCQHNGFHCAENPLDCLCHYSNWKYSVYYVVEAMGDIDEIDYDSQISCTELKIIKELSFMEFLMAGVAYMVKYYQRSWSTIVQKDSGIAYNGYVVVRGKEPQAMGAIGAILVMLREATNGSIMEVAVFTVDGKDYHADTWYDVTGKAIGGAA